MKRFLFVGDIKYPIMTRIVNPRSAKSLHISIIRYTLYWWKIDSCDDDLFIDFCRGLFLRGAIIILSEYMKLVILIIIFFLLGNERLPTNFFRYNLNKHCSSRHTRLLCPFGGIMSRCLRMHCIKYMRESSDVLKWKVATCPSTIS